MQSPSQSALPWHFLPASFVRHTQRGVGSMPWGPNTPLQARQPSSVVGVADGGSGVLGTAATCPASVLCAGLRAQVDSRQPGSEGKSHHSRGRVPMSFPLV